MDKLTGGVGQVAKLRKVKFLQGRATLTGPRLDDDRGQRRPDRTAVRALRAGHRIAADAHSRRCHSTVRA